MRTLKVLCIAGVFFGLAFCASVCFAQTGVCKPGVNCKVRTVTATVPSGVGVQMATGTCAQFSSDAHLYRSSANALTLSTTCGGPSNGTLTLGAVKVYGTSDFLSTATITNSTAGSPLTVNDLDGIALVGAATVNLTACNATAPPAGTRGAWQYDTTTNTMKFCNGTAWQNITPDTNTNTWEGKLSGYWPLPTSDGAAITFVQTRMKHAGNTATLYWVPTTTGVGAGNVTITVRNVTTATIVCAPTVLCTTAAFTATELTCASTLVALGDEIAIQYTGACTAASNPTGNVALAYTE